MIKIVEATIDAQGMVQLSVPVQLDGSRRALVTILDEPPAEMEAATTGEPALLSESALAKDWNRSEEDRAWAHLQQRTSS